MHTQYTEPDSQATKLRPGLRICLRCMTSHCVGFEFGCIASTSCNPSALNCGHSPETQIMDKKRRLSGDADSPRGQIVQDRAEVALPASAYTVHCTRFTGYHLLRLESGSACTCMTIHCFGVWLQSISCLRPSRTGMCAHLNENLAHRHSSLTKTS